MQRSRAKVFNDRFRGVQGPLAALQQSEDDEHVPSTALPETMLRLLPLDANAR